MNTLQTNMERVSKIQHWNFLKDRYETVYIKKIPCSCLHSIKKLWKVLCITVRLNINFMDEIKNKTKPDYSYTSRCQGGCLRGVRCPACV